MKLHLNILPIPTKNIIPSLGKRNTTLKIHTKIKDWLNSDELLIFALFWVFFVFSSLSLSWSLLLYFDVWVDALTQILMPTVWACIILHDLDWVITFNVWARESVYEILQWKSMYGGAKDHLAYEMAMRIWLLSTQWNSREYWRGFCECSHTTTLITGWKRTHI